MGSPRKYNLQAKRYAHTIGPLTPPSNPLTGTLWFPGENVGIGKDHTLFATIDGTVTFREKTDKRTYVSIKEQAAS